MFKILDFPTILDNLYPRESELALSKRKRERATSNRFGTRLTSFEFDFTIYEIRVKNLSSKFIACNKDVIVFYGQ